MAPLVIALVGLASDSASAAVSVCLPKGEAAGQCKGVEGIAVNKETGNLYVPERENHRVSVFESDGTFLYAFGWGVDTGALAFEKCTTASGCQAGKAGAGAGQFSSPSFIAVDNSGGANQGEVYVGTDNFRVQRFDEEGNFILAFGWEVNKEEPKAELQVCTTATGCQAGVEGNAECQIARPNDRIATGPEGHLFVADAYQAVGFHSRVQEFGPGGECVASTSLFGPTAEQPNQRVREVAIDSAKDAFVTVEAGGGALRKYDLGSSETKLCEDASFETNALASDDKGRVFAAQREKRTKGGIFQSIAQYGPSCEALHRFGYGQIASNASGLAGLDEDTLFIGEGGGFGAGAVHDLEIPPPGPIIVPASLEVLEVTKVSATLRAEVNPNGKATKARIQYLTQADWEAQGESFEGPGTEETEAVELGDGTSLVAFEELAGCEVASKAAIEAGECLTPETKYRWRAIAVNEDDESEAGLALAEGPPFTTLDSIDVQAIWTAAVGTDAATLAAQVDPLGIPATGHFQYVEQSVYEESGFAEALSLPTEAEAEIDFGSGKGPAIRSATATGLAEGTLYRYRLAAINPLIEAFQLSKEEKTFTTFRKASSPPCPNDELRTGPAAYLPDCRAYELVSPLDKAGGEIVSVGTTVTQPGVGLRQASPDGEKLVYASYRAFGDAKSAPWTSQYLATRTAEGWQSHGIDPPAGKSIRGSAEIDTQLEALSEDLCEAWITPFFETEPPLAEGAPASYLNIYRRTDSLCGEEAFETITTAKPETIEGRGQNVETQGHSGSVTAFAVNATLEGTTSPPQPGCEPSGVSCKVRLYVKGPAALEGPTAPPRYACILPGGAPSGDECSAGTNHGAVPPIGTNRTASLKNALSEDGTKLYWTDSIDDGRIYLRENPLGEGTECTGAGTPCTKDVSKAGETLTGSTSSHFWAAAADGSRALYTTRVGISGGSDLYEYDAATEGTRKIAGGMSGLLGASEDARRVYLVSTEVLGDPEEETAIGEKAEAGKPNLYFQELPEGGGEASYRFIGTLSAADAASEPGNESSAVAREPRQHNSRVSPDGLAAAFMSTRPLSGHDNTDQKSGEADNEVFVYDAEAEKLRCASCNPSGARPLGQDVGNNPLWIAARLPTHSTALYPGRLLSEDGDRLFFESADPIAPRDVNAKIDVYQWEALGKGTCTEEAAGFSAAAEGCIDLISSGQSERRAELLDASATGNDVFFATLASLVPTDPGLVDVYDARAGGGFTQPALALPECEGESCQSPPPAPEPQALGSASFVGPGNLAAPKKKAKRCPKGKRKVKRKGKVRCIKKKRSTKRANRAHHRHLRAARPQ